MRKTPYILAFTTLLCFAAGCAPQPKEDPRIAQLQKELDDIKQKAAAEGKAIAEQTASTQQAITDQTANAQQALAAQKATTEQALTEQKAAMDRALADQKAAAEQKAIADQKVIDAQKALAADQAAANDKLRRELDDMKPREFTLPSGTTIAVRTTAELSTKSVKNGSVFEAILERDLQIDGTTIAKSGSRVTCVVVESDPGGRVKGVASLSVAAKSIAAVGANTLAVSTNSYEVTAQDTTKKDVRRTGIATGVGAAIGAIAGGGKGAAIGAGVGAGAGVGGALATRGAAAVIPTETLIEFKLAAPAKVVLRK